MDCKCKYLISTVFDLFHIKLCYFNFRHSVCEFVNPIHENLIVGAKFLNHQMNVSELEKRLNEQNNKER